MYGFLTLVTSPTCASLEISIIKRKCDSRRLRNVFQQILLEIENLDVNLMICYAISEESNEIRRGKEKYGFLLQSMYMYIAVS